MDRRQLLATGVVAGMAAGVSSSQADDGKNNDIVGSWFGTVTATNPPLGQFNDLISFHVGGVVIESRRYFVSPTPFGDLLETTGHGAWQQTDKNTFKAFFRFLIQTAANGTAIGTDNVQLLFELDPEARALSGTFQSQIKNPADTVLLTVTGTFAATAITT
jgi:hypothetical protein